MTATTPRNPVTADVKPGVQVTFEHGDVTLTGVVNGEPFVMFLGWHNAQAYVPVHVHDGNHNLVVHIGNLVEMRP